MPISSTRFPLRGMLPRYWASLPEGPTLWQLARLAILACWLFLMYKAYAGEQRLECWSVNSISLILFLVVIF